MIDYRVILGGVVLIVLLGAVIFISVGGQGDQLDTGDQDSPTEDNRNIPESTVSVDIVSTDSIRDTQVYNVSGEVSAVDSRVSYLEVSVDSSTEEIPTSVGPTRLEQQGDDFRITGLTDEDTISITVHWGDGKSEVIYEYILSDGSLTES